MNLFYKKQFFKYFALLFFSLSSVVGLILYLFFAQEQDSRILVTQTNEQNHITLQKYLIEADLKSILSDLAVLASVNELKASDEQPSANQVRFLAQEYLNFSSNKKIYDKIRLLDQTGQEVVRVNFNQDQPMIVPETQLQSKANRYYFKKTIALNQNEVFISPFDLNIENGKVEQPLKPMIRLATPVFNNVGEKKGIVILNYLGENLLENLTQANLTSLGEVMLVNSEGYWLKSPNSEDEWGFMFPDKQDRTFGNDYPEVWQKIKTLESGQLITNQGLFSFTTVYPMNDKNLSLKPESSDFEISPNSKLLYWKIISYVPSDTLNATTHKLAKEMLILYSGLLILIALVSAGTSRIMVKRQQAQLELKQSEESLRAAYLKDRLKSDVSRQIRDTLDLSQILATSVDKIRDLLQLDRCTFSWYQPNLETASWDVIQEAKAETIDSVLGLYPLTSLGALGEKLLSLETIQVDDVECLSDPVMKDLLKSLGFMSILMLPIQTRSQKLGVLTCGHCRQARPWSEDDVELVTGVVEQLAIALNQGELYQESRVNASIAQAQAEQIQGTLEKLQATQTQLIQTEKMSSLGQMVAGIAHEINNPVSFIFGNLTYADEYTEQLLELLELYQEHYPDPDPDIQDYADEIDLDYLKQDLPKLLASMKVGANRIRDIVLSLRIFSRLDEAEMKSVNLHEGLDSALLLLQNRLNNPEGDRPPINLVKNYGTIPEVECYASQVNQVFMNIINNAIDALQANFQRFANSDEAPSMTMSISTKQINPDWVSVTIADNGVGMSNQVKQRIFDPFFTTKPVGQGTGLGLSIAYDIIVQKHGGSIDCISEPGKGTEFIIKLPVHPRPSLMRNPSESAELLTSSPE
jgi:signal transduction histidine kinase